MPDGCLGSGAERAAGILGSDRRTRNKNSARTEVIIFVKAQNVPAPRNIALFPERCVGLDERQALEMRRVGNELARKRRADERAKRAEEQARNI